MDNWHFIFTNPISNKLFNKFEWTLKVIKFTNNRIDFMAGFVKYPLSLSVNNKYNKNRFSDNENTRNYHYGCRLWNISNGIYGRGSKYGRETRLDSIQHSFIIGDTITWKIDFINKTASLKIISGDIVKEKELFQNIPDEIVPGVSMHNGRLELLDRISL